MVVFGEGGEPVVGPEVVAEALSSLKLPRLHRHGR